MTRMFKYGVSAALETLPASLPVTLRGSIESLCVQAKKTGYDALELHIREPSHLDINHIKETCLHYNMPVCALANGMEYTKNGLSLIDDDSNRRETAISRLLEHADLAAELNAKLIVGIMRGNIPPEGEP